MEKRDSPPTVTGPTQRSKQSSGIHSPILDFLAQHELPKLNTHVYKLSLKVPQCIHAGAPLASIEFVLYYVFSSFYNAVLKTLVLQKSVQKSCQ